MPDVAPSPLLPDASRQRWAVPPAAALFLLLLGTILPYLGSLQVPFYLDDTNNIVDNQLLRDLPATARGLLTGRGVAIFTFALNYRFGGLDPFGYHLVNLAIHIGAVGCVWLLLRRLLGRDSNWPLAGALLFAVHPLQTQAVTYVVQRMTSLCGFFFLAALCAYLCWLDSAAGPRRLPVYLLAVGCGALSVLTKENGAVLPLALLLVERIFRPGRGWRAQVLGLLPFCLAPAWKGVEMFLLPVWRGDAAAAVRYADQLQGLQAVTPWRYLATEFAVLWHYLRLFFWPYGQVLDYHWPVATSFWGGPQLLALAGLLSLGVLAWRVRRRRPLLACGIAWFFVTLSVESSIIPLDPVFEHRLYLPMFGLVLVALDLLQLLPWARWRLPLLVTLLAALAGLTWQRNALWADPVAFLEDNLRRQPGNVRVMVMLGSAHAARQRPAEARQLLEQALRLNPRYDFAYTTLGKLLLDQGQADQALAPLLQGLQYQPDSLLLNEYLGIAYGEIGDFTNALLYLRRALRLQPQDASLLTNLGVIHARLGDNRQAAELFARSLRLVPDNEQTLFNQAAVLFNLGDRLGALQALRATVRVNPRNLDAQYGLATLALEYGSRQEAQAARLVLRQHGDEERARELDLLLNR